MPRPFKKKCIRYSPTVLYFKPRGVPLSGLEEVVLYRDEVEALRLKDVEGMDQSECAKLMNISQSTFQRIITAAHQKTALAVIRGKALKISDISRE